MRNCRCSQNKLYVMCDVFPVCIFHGEQCGHIYSECVGLTLPFIRERSFRFYSPDMRSSGHERNHSFAPELFLLGVT